MATLKNFRSDVIMAAVSQQPKTKHQLKRVAHKIRDDARSLARDVTGRLDASLTAWDEYNPATQMVEYRVGWNLAIAHYGWMVEAGTETARAQPHLRPAAIKNGGTAPRAGGL